MNTPDFKRAYLLAQLSSIAYLTDADAIAAAVEAAGFGFVGIVFAPGFQALVVTETGGQIVVFRGTPVTCGRDICDAVVALGYDAGLDHTDVGIGAKVLTGPYQAIKAKWPEIAKLLDPAKPITFTGHSLGGASALIAPAFVPRAMKVSVTAFAPFQAANGTFWLGLYGGRDLPLIVGRERDFAPGWNHLDPVTCHPCTILHMAKGKTEWLPHWPWCDEDVSDHDVSGYVADMQRFAGQMAEA